MSAGQADHTSRCPARARRIPRAPDFKASTPSNPIPDNDQSVGFVLQFGKFQFHRYGRPDLELRDRSWSARTNLIGKIDLYQTTHHGLERSNSPQFVWAIQPRVAVMNNGPRKGGPASVFEILRKSPGLEDIWQGHLALGTPKEVNTDEKMIANLGPSADCPGI